MSDQENAARAVKSAAAALNEAILAAARLNIRTEVSTIPLGSINGVRYDRVEVEVLAKL